MKNKLTADRIVRTMIGLLVPRVLFARRCRMMRQRTLADFLAKRWFLKNRRAHRALKQYSITTKSVKSVTL